MLILIGFTQSDRPNGYSSFDGYKEGAQQKVIVADLRGYDESDTKIERIADAAFTATNHPEPETLTGLSGALFHAIYDSSPPYVRSLSVGDTVTIPERGERVACESIGWEKLSPAPFTYASVEEADAALDRGEVKVGDTVNLPSEKFADRVLVVTRDALQCDCGKGVLCPLNPQPEVTVTLSFLATMNVPGYMPMDDDPPTFETAAAAWDYLAGERKRGEDDYEGDGYSETVNQLEQAATGTMDAYQDYGLDLDGTGTIYGDTPGYEGDHDLGLAYNVQVVT